MLETLLGSETALTIELTTGADGRVVGIDVRLRIAEPGKDATG